MNADAGVFLFVLLCFGLYHAARAVHQSIQSRARDRLARQATADRLHNDLYKAEQKRREMNQRARNMQIALMQLPNAPDFERAAHWAEQCRGVPAAFRGRQFVRFRQLLLTHLRNRVAAGASIEDLTPSLKRLLTALAVAPFEADYLIAELDQQPSPLAENANQFQHQLASLHQEHQRRMDVLNNMTSLADDVREQLLEAEQQRFHGRLFGRGGA